jgi:myo-inositol-1(or 4)-monophosphatase
MSVPSREGRPDAGAWQATGQPSRTRASGARAAAGDAGLTAHRPAGELLAIAVRAATLAAEIVQAKSTGLATLRWDEKSPSDFVSDVDRTSEECLRSVIRDLAPEAQVLGEEFTPDLGGTAPLASLPGTVFVADPLDGTTNYLHGYPEYAVSIGVLVDGVLTAGVIRHAVTGDTYTATAGGGAYRNGTRLAVSTITLPGRALIGTGFPFAHVRWLDQYQPQFAAVSRHVAGIRRAGSAALDLASVAAGRFDAFWELMLAPWDIAAGILLVREAGGLVTDLSGAPAPVGHTPIVAGNPDMHGWLLDTLRQVTGATEAAATP